MSSTRFSRIQKRSSVFAAAPVWTAASTSSTEPDGINNYLYGVLVPTQAGYFSIPDLDMTPCIPKSVGVSQLIRWPTDADKTLFIVFTPENPFYPVRTFIRDAGGEMAWLANFQPDDPLALNFRSARLHSAQICIKSNTVSSTNAALGGAINGNTLATIPAFSTLTFNSLPAYEQGPGTGVREIRAEDGVLALHRPNGPHTFWVPETPNTCSANGTFTVAQSDFGTSNGWITINPDSSVANALYDSRRPGVSPLWPDPSWGWMRFTGMVRLERTTVGAGGDLNLVLVGIYNVADPITWATAFEEHTIVQTHQVSDTAVTLYFDSGPVYITRLLYGVRMRLFTPAGSAWTTKSSTYLRVENLSYYAPNSTQPCTILACKALEEGQMASLTATLNYEVVPDSELQKNMPVRTNVEDPIEMELAEAMLAQVGQGRLRTIYSESDYKQLLLSGYFETMCRGDALYSAASPSLKAKLRGVLAGAGRIAGSVMRSHGSDIISTGVNAVAPGWGSLAGQAAKMYYAADAEESPGSPVVRKKFEPWDFGERTGSGTGLMEWAAGRRREVGPGLYSTAFPVVADSGDCRIANIVFSSTKPTPDIESFFVTADFTARGGGSLQIAGPLLEILTADAEGITFLRNLRDLMQSYDYGRHEWYLYLTTPVDFVGHSLQLAVTLACLGISSNRFLFSGTIFFDDDGCPTVGPVGKLAEKLECAATESRPLIFYENIETGPGRDDVAYAVEFASQYLDTTVGVRSRREAVLGTAVPDKVIMIGFQARTFVDVMRTLSTARAMQKQGAALKSTPLIQVEVGSADYNEIAEAYASVLNLVARIRGTKGGNEYEKVLGQMEVAVQAALSQSETLAGKKQMISVGGAHLKKAYNYTAALDAIMKKLTTTKPKKQTQADKIRAARQEKAVKLRQTLSTKRSTTGTPLFGGEGEG